MQRPTQLNNCNSLNSITVNHDTCEPIARPNATRYFEPQVTTPRAGLRTVCETAVEVSIFETAVEVSMDMKQNFIAAAYFFETAVEVNSGSAC